MTFPLLSFCIRSWPFKKSSYFHLSKFILTRWDRPVYASFSRIGILREIYLGLFFSDTSNPFYADCRPWIKAFFCRGLGKITGFFRQNFGLREHCAKKTFPFFRGNHSFSFSFLNSGCVCFESKCLKPVGIRMLFITSFGAQEAKQSSRSARVNDQVILRKGQKVRLFVARQSMSLSQRLRQCMLKQKQTEIILTFYNLFCDTWSSTCVGLECNNRWNCDLIGFL